MKKHIPTTKQKQNDRWNKIKDSYSWDYTIDYRKHPHLYRVGKGEQGVLICQPYKSEIGSHWKFKTPEIAKVSSDKIIKLFHDYLKKNEFVGADMARKYLQMGYTRSRRYANRKSGRKYDKLTGKELPLDIDETGMKQESARIFYEKWKEAEDDEKYSVMKKEWKQKYG